MGIFTQSWNRQVNPPKVSKALVSDENKNTIKAKTNPPLILKRLIEWFKRKKN